MIRIMRNATRGCILVLAVTALSLAGSGAASLAGAAAASSGNQERVFVEELAEKAVGALTHLDLPDVQHETNVRALLGEYFAISPIGQWVLDRCWRNATPEQRSEYLMLFENMIVVTYRDRFKRSSDQLLTVTNVVDGGESGDEAVVQSKASHLGAARPVGIAWRVRSEKGAMKIVDVIVEGVSMGQTQRSEFSSIIARSGGNISPLLEQMRRVVAQRS